MSKGSRARPLSVPQETFAERWGRIFGPSDHELAPIFRDILEYKPKSYTIQPPYGLAADPETKETA